MHTETPKRMVFNAQMTAVNDRVVVGISRASDGQVVACGVSLTLRTLGNGWALLSKRLFARAHDYLFTLLLAANRLCLLNQAQVEPRVEVFHHPIDLLSDVALSTHCLQPLFVSVSGVTDKCPTALRLRALWLLLRILCFWVVLLTNIFRWQLR